MEGHKSDEEAGSGEGSSSPSIPESVKESIALEADTNSDPASEISPLLSLPSTSKSYLILDESGVDRSPICLDDIEHDALRDSSTLSSSDSSEDNTKSSKTQQSVKNVIKSTKSVKTIRDHVFLRPITEHLEDKDAGTAKIVAGNSPRLSPAAETASNAEEQTCSNISEPETDIITPISSVSSDSQLGYDAEDSSSSLDIATNISSLKIVDAEQSKIHFESHAKRKYTSPDLSGPVCSSGVSRKAHHLDEKPVEMAATNVSTAVVSGKVRYLDEKPVEMAATDVSTAESQDKNMDISPPSAGEMDTSDLTSAQLETPRVSDSEDVPEYVMGTKYSRSKENPAPFPDEEASGSKARRELFRRLAVKRAKQTSSSSGDDIADKPDEPKKKKESEPKKRKESEE